jgi:hypothetical protein
MQIKSVIDITIKYEKILDCHATAKLCFAAPSVGYADSSPNF